MLKGTSDAGEVNREGEVRGWEGGEGGNIGVLMTHTHPVAVSVGGLTSADEQRYYLSGWNYYHCQLQRHFVCKTAEIEKRAINMTM